MKEKFTSVDILLENYLGPYNVFSGNKLKCNYNLQIKIKKQIDVMHIRSIK